MKNNENLRIVKEELPTDVQKTGSGGWRKWAAVAGILGGGGLAVHAILSRHEKKHLRPPGRMIDVNGHMMHIFATGSGGPTVVLETGASGYFGAWEWVQQEVGKHTRVVSYDRAGLGFSEKTPGSRDAASIARELWSLLGRSGEKPPYILVGHSYGGLLVMEFANLYPEQTAGLILVDPSHPDQIARSPELRKSMRNFRKFFHVASAASHFGVMRVTDLLSSMSEGLSGSERARARVFFVSGRHLKSSARELDAWKETTEQTRSVHFGKLPLLILSAPEPQIQWVKEFQKMHEEMSSLSTRSTHRIVQGAEHLNIVTRHENALHVSRGILEVVDEVRRGSKA